MASQWLSWRQIPILMFMLGVGFFFFISTTQNITLPTFEKVKVYMPLPLREEDASNSRSTLLSVDHARRLAATVVEVQKEIQRLAGTNASVDAKWSLKLASVAAELDPRISLENKHSPWDYSARIPSMGPAPQVSNITRHVCPEVYLGKDYDRPIFQLGMEAENCTYVPKFSDVLTVVLPASDWERNRANFVVQQIRKYYDIPIIATVSSGDHIENNLTSITVIEHDKKQKESEVLNTAVLNVTTPYLFIGKSMTHFNNQSSLERLVRVLDELDHVEVTGGAARDLQGHWIHGCLQQRMANYQVYYAMGYYYSKYECMYCDDLLTPFVTTKKLMTDIPLTTGLHGSAMYRDWFAKVRQKGHLTMTCPDVMFYISNHTTMSKEDWLTMSREWGLEKVLAYDGQVYEFTCDSVGISCAKPLDIIKSYLLPQCCRALMEKYLSYIIDYGKQHELLYELHAGSALGAMKFNGYLPWDFDMDIEFKCKDYKKWFKIKNYVRKIHCSLNVMVKNIYFTINCPHFFLELVCRKNNATSLQYIPSVYQSIPTKISYGDMEVNVRANPGLYCRNAMGMDDLKHAAHWRTLKVSSLGKAKGGYDNPGTWNQCKDPNHHSCLDHFPGDGNLPFHQPFLLL